MQPPPNDTASLLAAPTRRSASENARAACAPRYGATTDPPKSQTLGISPGRKRLLRGALPMKRLFDLALTLGTAPLWFPVIGMLALVLWWRVGSPVFFRQTRPGLYGVPFQMVKLRTMHNLAGPDGQLLPDGARLTPFGRTLRRTSLDELPELWNVLKGEMSLVGPRPLLMEYLPLFSARQERRHEVKPGITGWAQVNGRNALGWEEKFDLDVWYVDHRSFWLDLRILAVTVWRVIKRDGISPQDQEIMPRFTGVQPPPRGNGNND